MIEQADLLAVPEQAAPPVGEPSATTQRLHFTGSGKEYFRIWIVNLTLTIATLGIYSAWAKVRRLQYFDRNTILAGASFDFCGNPRAILKGRLLAVALLTLYHYAFGFSRVFGVVVASALVLALPFLMRGALRFRLTNTRYRGLALGFTGSTLGAYVANLPPVITFLLPGVLVALYPFTAWAAISFLLYLGWPLMHGAMKGYQHRHLAYGDQQASYTLSAWRFMRPYLLALLLFMLGGVVVGIAVGIVAAVAAALGGLGQGGNSASQAVMFSLLPALVGLYVLFLLVGPYMQVRLANLTWSNTAFPRIRIRSTLKVWPFMRLQVANTILTLLTLGLYRPFAVVRVYQYRLAQVELEVDGDIEQIAAGAAPRPVGAAGDGAADFLGVDLSW
ncbi:YjgN family protein [Massilia horti]|uniref:DUF898 domain-containing protein n=1 Tax=Massilia horti TaxID=2562153 RepID=A0A4Y9T6G1_9BURK|nr:YjgN family protein [Massilia horti]TFW36164.1 DUF898 domain-containing protein [Massilia horti]